MKKSLTKSFKKLTDANTSWWEKIKDILLNVAIMVFSFSALVKSIAFQKLEVAGLRLKYFQIVDGNTLIPVRNFEGSDFIVVCTAVFAGEVRLIDNLVLMGEA
jgi:pantothenate synthetase